MSGAEPPPGRPLEMPRAGDIWKHHGGVLYCIRGIGNDTRDGNAVVIYEPLPINGWRQGLWVRPLGEFLGFTADHKRRFVREEALCQ